MPLSSAYPKRNRGVFVASLELEDVADIYLARRAIEREAVTIIVRRADDAAFARLNEVVEEMSSAAERGAWKELADADLRFHESLVRSSNSKRLQRKFSTLLIETRMCLAQLETDYPVHKRLVQEHRNLLDAMRQGDERAALALIDAHLKDAVKDLTSARRGCALSEGPSCAGSYRGYSLSVVEIQLPEGDL